MEKKKKEKKEEEEASPTTKINSILMLNLRGKKINSFKRQSRYGWHSENVMASW